MPTILTVFGSIMFVSVIEMLVVQVIIPEKSSSLKGYLLLRYLFIPLLHGLVAFSVVLICAHALSWFDEKPSIKLVILLGILMSHGRILQIRRAAPGSDRESFLIGFFMHVLGTILGGLYVL